MGIPVPSPLSSGEKVAARPDEGVCPPEEWQLPLILFLLKVLRAAHCDSWFCRLCCVIAEDYGGASDKNVQPPKMPKVHSTVVMRSRAVNALRRRDASGILWGNSPR